MFAHIVFDKVRTVEFSKKNWGKYKISLGLKIIYMESEIIYLVYESIYLVYESIYLVSIQFIWGTIKFVSILKISYGFLFLGFFTI